MSALPRTNDDFGIVGLRMTAAEFFALGESPERVELIDGVVVLSPSPTPRHQELVQAIFEGLLAHKRLIRVYLDTDLQVSADLVYRPDVSVYTRVRLPETPRRLATPPDLVVEVLSPGSKPLDLITKRGDYERFGVAEYWVIDPADLHVRCWRREGERLLEASAPVERVESSAIPGFHVDIAALRDTLL